MYAMICTRPDVAFAISLTSRYQANPGESHWAAVNTILKYLKRTKEMFLVYGGEEELVVRGYADASFQTDRDDCRSVQIRVCHEWRNSELDEFQARYGGRFDHRSRIHCDL